MLMQNMLEIHCFSLSCVYNLNGFIINTKKCHLKLTLKLLTEWLNSVSYAFKLCILTLVH